MLADTVFSSTSGAFDPTVGPLVNLWGFGPKVSSLESVPTEGMSRKRYREWAFEHLVIDEARSEVVKTRDVMIDLSAIAKGYAVDQIGGLLDEQGSDSYFIEIGGELKIKGVKAGMEAAGPCNRGASDRAFEVYEIFSNLGQSIAVALAQEIIATILKLMAFAIRMKSIRAPVGQFAIIWRQLMSLPIQPALADALATAYMVMGEEFAYVHAEERGIAVFLIAREGDAFAERISSAFKPYLGEQ